MAVLLSFRLSSRTDLREPTSFSIAFSSFSSGERVTIVLRTPLFPFTAASLLPVVALRVS